MVESWDFTLGAIVGAVIGVVSTFVANYLSDVLRERKRHKRVVKAFIKELTLIRDHVHTFEPYKSIAIGTPVFSKFVVELPILKELTAEMLLNTYSDIKFYIRTPAVLLTDQIKELESEIDTTISLLREEVD